VKYTHGQKPHWKRVPAPTHSSANKGKSVSQCAADGQENEGRRENRI